MAPPIEQPLCKVQYTVLANLCVIWSDMLEKAVYSYARTSCRCQTVQYIVQYNSRARPLTAHGSTVLTLRKQRLDWRVAVGRPRSLCACSLACGEPQVRSGSGVFVCMCTVLEWNGMDYTVLFSNTVHSTQLHSTVLKLQAEYLTIKAYKYHIHFSRNS